MSVNRNVDFVNAAAAGEQISCLVCGAKNAPDSNFCLSCGSPLRHSAPVKTVPETEEEPETVTQTPPEAPAEEPKADPTPAVFPSLSDTEQPKQEPVTPPTGGNVPTGEGVPSEVDVSPFPPAEEQPVEHDTATEQPVRPGPAEEVFSVASDPAAVEPVSQEPEQPVSYTGPVSAFAEGLPDWDLVPPHVMVRRR